MCRNPSGQPIRLGVIYLFDSSSGAGADLGIDFALARRGPERGHRVELVAEQDICAPEQGQLLRSSNVTGRSIVAVIGPTCSKSAETAVPVLASRGISVISPNATGAEPKKGLPFFFRTSYNDGIQGDAMADFALKRLGVRSAATLRVDYPTHSELLEQRFSERFAAGGGLLELRREIPWFDRSIPQEYRRTIQAIRIRRPGFVYTPLFGNEGAIVARLIRETEGLEDVPFGGSDAITYTMDFDFVHAAGTAAAGVLASIPKPDVAKWFRRDLRRWALRSGGLSGGPLRWWAATAFDATNLVLDAVEAVGIESDGSLYVSRTALRDRLRGTSGYRGASGFLTCTSGADCNPRVPVIVKEVRDTRFLPVWTWQPSS